MKKFSLAIVALFVLCGLANATHPAASFAFQTYSVPVQVPVYVQNDVFVDHHGQRVFFPVQQRDVFHGHAQRAVRGFNDLQPSFAVVNERGRPIIIRPRPPVIIIR